MQYIFNIQGVNTRYYYMIVITLLLISHEYKTFCFADHYFEAVKAVRIIQYVAADLNFNVHLEDD